MLITNINFISNNMLNSAENVGLIQAALSAPKVYQFLVVVCLLALQAIKSRFHFMDGTFLRYFTLFIGDIGFVKFTECAPSFHKTKKFGGKQWFVFMGK